MNSMAEVKVGLRSFKGVSGRFPNSVKVDSCPFCVVLSRLMHSSRSVFFSQGHGYLKGFLESILRGTRKLLTRQVKLKSKYSVINRPEFLVSNPEVLGLIPGATKFSA
jgi:hypothetical protein